MKNRTSHENDLLEAHWASKLVSIYPERTNLTTGLLHYWALRNKHHLKPDSSRYSNTVEDYKYLIDACVKAHCLGLLPFHLFSEHESICISENIFAPYYSGHLGHWRAVFKHMFDRLCISYVECMAGKLNPVHIEIWVDNSNSAPVVKPVADRYRVNIISSHRPMSINAIFKFVRRISQIRKPIMVLHLSDFDPCNVNHHLRTKAKLDMLLEHFQLAGKLNIEVRHLMLSADQCRALELPTEPHSRNSKNPKTELTSLEAGNPGYIGRTLEQNLERYIDLPAARKTSTSVQNAINNMLPQLRVIIDNNASLERAMQHAERQLSRL